MIEICLELHVLRFNFVRLTLMFSRDELKKKEEELRGFEARLLQECGSQDVGATLEQYQQSITNLQRYYHQVLLLLF